MNFLIQPNELPSTNILRDSLVEQQYHLLRFFSVPKVLRLPVHCPIEIMAQ